MPREVCRHFQSGSCRFGDKCRYLHVTQQQPKSNPFGFGVGASDHQQKSNPYGFGVQNNSHSKVATDFGSNNNQFNKPFENKWTRPSATSATTTTPRRSDNQPQAKNHECKDPESCRSIINEDFKYERPLWKLTCYGHGRNSACDIGGDISYEELRAVAYDDAKRGVNFPSIVERERNLVITKSNEFENLCKPRAIPLNSPAIQSPFPSSSANAFSQTAQSRVPPSVSSFSQLGTSPNMGFGQRPSAPATNGFLQPNLFPNSSHASIGFGTTNIPSANTVVSQFPTSTQGINSTLSVMRPESNQFFTPAVSSQIPSTSSSSAVSSLFPSASSSQPIGQVPVEVKLLNDVQREEISGDMSIWLKKKWTPGEIPEEEPPEALVGVDL